MDSRVNSHSEKFVVARGGKSGGSFSVKTKATREKPNQRPRVHANSNAISNKINKKIEEIHLGCW